MTQDQHIDEWMKKAEELIREYGDDRGRASESAAVFDRVGARSARDAADITLAALLAHLQQRPLPVREATDAFERAMKASWEMVDVFRPSGQPGSYARGEYNGIVGTLRTVRDNYTRALAASPSLPVREEPTDEQIDALAMRCCGDLRGDRLCMTRDQRINFARRVLASPSVQNMGEGETGKDGVKGRTE